MRGLLFAVVALLTSCDQPFQRTTVGGTTYPYGPVSCEIHELSRLQPGTGSSIYGEVVCVEFKDLDKQPTRADGSIALEFGVPGALTEKLYDLNDRDINNHCWNRAIQMYEFKNVFIPQLESAPKDGVRVKVTWTPIDGKAITLQAVLMAPVR